MERLKEPISLKAKLLITALILIIVSGGSYVAYKFYDFTQNNPKFCVGCHLMQPAYDSWSQSEHKTLNCHDCHHLTIPEQNQLLSALCCIDRPQVPERHKGQVIVSSKTCNTVPYGRKGQADQQVAVPRQARVHGADRMHRVPRRGEGGQERSAPLPSHGKVLHQVPQGKAGARRGHGRTGLHQLPYRPDQGPQARAVEVPVLPQHG